MSQRAGSARSRRSFYPAHRIERQRVQAKAVLLLHIQDRGAPPYSVNGQGWVGEEKYVLLRQQRGEGGEVGSAWGLGSARTAEFLYWRAVEVVAAQVSEMPLGESESTFG